MENESVFQYVGLRMEQHNNYITLDRIEYISKLNPITIIAERRSMKDAFLTEHEHRNLRIVVGQLNWVASQTRPDIAFEVCQLSTKLNGAIVEDLKRANKCINRLKSENVKMRFENVGDLQKTHLAVFADASYGKLEGSVSQGGFISFLTNGNGQCCPI